MKDLGLLAIIPARAGSKGLPGKNIRIFAGLPLIAHSIKLAQQCSRISRLIVSTDSDEIARVARQFGAEVPFMRPESLAQDDTPMWPVIRHALEKVEQEDAGFFEHVLLLDPTTPCRLPAYIDGALGKLAGRPAAAGIIGVSRPDFNPLWHCVTEERGWMKDFSPQAASYDRRQDVPVVYRINGSLYIWRADFVRSENTTWRRGKHLIYEVPDFSAISIDNQAEFERAELFVKAGLVKFSWVELGSPT